jgi:putative peptidoglycan lipid II flippase
MIPTLIGSSVAQVNLLFDTLIASFLIAGSVSWLNYSDRLLEFPIGVFGVALATVILPSLSQKHARQSTVEFSATLDWALRLAVIITAPAAAGLAVLSAPLLATLFQYGAYQPDDVVMSSLSLIAYSAGLPAFIAVKILAPGFYARQDTRTPVRIAIIAMATNMLLNVLFVGSLIWIDFNGVHMGLALASSAAAYLNAGLLYKALRRQSVYVPAPGWGRFWSSVGLATFFMAAILIWLSPELQSWLAKDAWQRIIMLAPLVFGGGLAYLAGLYMTGTRANVFRR